MRRKQFKETVISIFERNGFCLVEQSDTMPGNDKQYYLMVRNGVGYCLLIRESRYLNYSSFDIVSAVQELVSYSKKRRWIPVTVVGAVLKSSVIAEMLGVSIRSTVVDIEHLLYMAKSYSDLYDQLVAELPYSIQSLKPQEPSFPNSIRYIWDDIEEKMSAVSVKDPVGCAADSQERSGVPGYKIAMIGERSAGKSSFLYSLLYENQTRKTNLCTEVEQWVCGKAENSSRQYEKLCMRTLMRLFAEDLTLWREQARSDEGLYRFDLVCKIKRDNRKDFWEMAERYFNSKYIIFEFKNYSDKITQEEIYSTARYLYPKALRAIAIIISPNGASNNANKAIRGLLREQGKLIISLTNDELIRMLQMKEDGEDPADYLGDKLDDLLVVLEK